MFRKHTYRVHAYADLGDTPWVNVPGRLVEARSENEAINIYMRHFAGLGFGPFHEPSAELVDS